MFILIEPFFSKKIVMNSSEKFRSSWLAVMVLAVQLCSVRAVIKYLPFVPYNIIFVFAISILLYYALIYRALPLKSILKSAFVSFILCFLIAVVNFILYPKADSLKLVMRGSDADDAVIIATTKLFQLKFPYDELTYMHHKMSPGPGMLLFMSPFVLSGLYVLAIPFYVTVFAYTLKYFLKDWEPANICLLILFSCLGFWEYMIIGSDLVVAGILLSVLFLSVIKNQRNTTAVVLLAILTGLLLTSRIIFIYLIPIPAFILFKTNRLTGMIFGLVATVCCLGTHALFYFWKPDEYAPMHLLGKGQHFTNTYVMAAGAAATVLLLIAFLREKSFSPANALKYYWLFVAVPHLFIGIGMVMTDGLPWTVTEGPGYLIVQLFLFLSFYFVQHAESLPAKIPRYRLFAIKPGRT